MPGWLQAWVKVNPVTMLADARAALLIGGPVATPAAAVAALGGRDPAVFAPLAVRAFRRRT